MAMRCFFPEVPAPAVRGENPLTTARVDVNCDRGWRVEFRQQNRPISNKHFVQDAFPCTFKQGIDKRHDRIVFLFRRGAESASVRDAHRLCPPDFGLDLTRMNSIPLLILMSVQDDTNYGMLSVVTDGWRNAWQDLDR